MEMFSVEYGGSVKLSDHKFPSLGGAGAGCTAGARRHAGQDRFLASQSAPHCLQQSSVQSYI